MVGRMRVARKPRLIEPEPIEPNPRAVIGGNHPPEEDGKPTVDEVQIVFWTVEYLVKNVPDLEGFLEKKKGKRKLGWRHVAFNLLKDRVRQNSAAVLLKFNRKTTGESQQRPDIWADMDPEFEAQMAALRAAVMAYCDSKRADAHVDIDAMEKKLKHFVSIDPDLRKMEERQRLHEAAAAEADAAAQAIEARRAGKKLTSSTGLKANHLPETVAKRLSPDALAALEKLAKKAAKSVHPLASTLNPRGLDECLREDLAESAEPHLSRASDKQHKLTKFGARVAEAAIDLGLIVKPKAKRGKIAA